MSRPGDGFGGPTWQEPDVFSELRRISKDLRALSRTVNATVRPDARYKGSDSSGAIGVTVDGRQHVQDVNVDARWSQRLDRTRLGDALMEAYGQAVCQLLTATSEAFDEAERDVDDADLEREVEQDLQSHYRRHVGPEDILEEVQDQLRKIELMERFGYGTPSGAAADQRDTTVYGPARFVEMTLSSGQISGIRVLLSRMPPMATNGTLAQEALGAFRAAARAAESRG